MKKILLFVGTIVCTFAASADDQCTTWGCQSTLESLYVNADGLIYIGTTLDETQANCTPVSNVYFTLNPAANANAKEIYAGLLAAFMSNSKIRLRIKEGHVQCELAYIELNVGL